MNARLAKLTLALCSLSLLNFTGSLHAQDTNAENVTPPPGSAGNRGRMPGYRGPVGIIEDSPMFNIQIENGELSLASLKDAPGKNPWETNTASVPATIDNLSKYLRAIDPTLNIIQSPEVGSVTILNLKLNTRSPLSISQAVGVASGGTIVGPGGGFGGGGFGGGLRGAERSLTFIANRPRESKPSVEVFNVSGYIQTLGKVDENVVRDRLDELENIVANTVTDMRIGKSTADVPNFKYHPGTKLLIVIGNPEAIEVTRKIINALPGQQKKEMEDLKQDLLDATPPSDQN